MNLFMAACAIGLFTASAASAQTLDGVKRDGAPVRVGDQSNMRLGPDGMPARDGVPARMYMNRDMDVAVARTVEPDRGGGVNDGDLWTSSLAVATSTAGAVVTVVSNTPIPDTVENRAQFGGPLSRAGRMTTPATGPGNR